MSQIYTPWPHPWSHLYFTPYPCYMNVYKHDLYKSFFKCVLPNFFTEKLPTKKPVENSPLFLMMPCIIFLLWSSLRAFP